MADNERDQDGDYLSLSALKRRGDSSISLKRSERDEDDVSNRYYHCDQWTSDEIKKLDERHQPVITYNRIQRKVDGVVGLMERLRQDPKAFPRTPHQEQGAELATATINYVLDNNRWKDISPLCARDGAVRFASGIELSIVPGDHQDPDVAMNTVDPNTFFYDPRSVREEFSDCRGMGIDKPVDLDQAIEMFPEHAEALKDIGDTGNDGPLALNGNGRTWVWMSGNECKIRLVEHWYIKGGEWRYCFYTGSMKLREGTRCRW